VSVDTYLKGKDTSEYLRVVHDDIEVLVSPVMASWSERVSVDSRSTLFGRRLEVAVEHEHGPACRH
jgi:hypothetical protein